jgi:osmoprotectant transport system permease protein
VATVLPVSAAPSGTPSSGPPPADDGPSCYSAFVNEWWCAQYVQDRRQEIVDATVQHLGITVSAVLFGVLLAFPLALLARRLPRLESTILGVSTGIYTIPSLALLPLMVPFTGLTATTVVIGLGLYALTVLVRAMLDGFRAVPADAVESATGLGYGPSRLLFMIELPLALPEMIAGLRIATVTTTSYVDRPATAGWYTYKVRAVDAAGNRSAFSTTVSAKAVRGSL